MRRQLFTAFLVLFPWCVNGSDIRKLTVDEQASLKAAAFEAAHIAVWSTRGYFDPQAHRDTSLAEVIFEPARVEGYCLAPTVFFRAQVSNGTLVDWAVAERGPLRYRFWFEDCDDADPEAAIVLEEFVDISVLGGALFSKPH